MCETGGPATPGAAGFPGPRSETQELLRQELVSGAGGPGQKRMGPEVRWGGLTGSWDTVRMQGESQEPARPGGGSRPPKTGKWSERG